MTRAFSIAACVVLGLVALNNIVRGGFHVLAPDGGVSRIPDLQLGSEGPTIIALFTVIGLNQVVIGIFQAAVLLRRRDLVQVTLHLQLTLMVAAVINLKFGRPIPVEVPGETFNMVLLPVVAAAWLLSLAAARSTRQAADSISAKVI